MIDRDKALVYLSSVMKFDGRAKVRADYMATAMSVQEEMGAHKAINRYTSGTETIPHRVAEAMGQSTNNVHAHMQRWLTSFKDVYDAKDPKYARICTPRMLEIVTPLQFLYLLTCDFLDNY